MSWPPTITISWRNAPYTISKIEAITLVVQKEVGDKTLPAFSDLSHCDKMRAENKSCAARPIP